MPHYITLFLLAFSLTATAQTERPPNIIVIFADDLGYGDLTCYGHPTIRTPHLDRMAAEGQRWTSFYTAANVCTPSRAALLTGRYPVRSGMASNKRRVLFPDSSSGLPDSEITLAELLKSAGYATAAIGKWHLGHLPPFLPTAHGFDSYFGIPYSNDMSKVTDLEYGDFWKQPHDSIFPENFDVPLMRDEQEIERPADQRTVTKRYTEETLEFIDNHSEEPFFVYLAHNLPHVPLFVSDDFLGTSARGLYGDVIEEIDDGVGRILDKLRESGLADNTIVVFTSDNGPWRSFGLDGGSPGPFRAGKGTTWEAGHRVPGIFWGPSFVAPGIVRGMGSTLDLLQTFSRMAGVDLPDDRVLDGYDLTETLASRTASPRPEMFYYHGTQLQAARIGDYKAHFITRGAYGQFGEREEHDPALLFHLPSDPEESTDLAARKPLVLRDLMAFVKRHQETVVPVEDQLVKRID